MADGIETRIATRQGITFTVNTALNEAALLLAGNPVFAGNVAIQYFAPGDNIIIKGVDFVYPYQFGQGSMDEPIFFQLGWFDAAAGNGPVNEVGDTGLINIPDPNYWYDMNVFVPYPAGITTKWGLRVIGLGGNVSMINAPAALNTEVLEAQIHLRIQHTSAMLA